MTKDEAMKLALEALERANQTAMLFSLKARVPECGEFAGIAQDLDWAVETLRQALEQPEQEPVAKVDITKKGYIAWLKHDGLEQDQLLYTAPPKPCVNRGLMEALKQIADETYDEWTNGAKAQRIAEAAIKAALKEKNHD